MFHKYLLAFSVFNSVTSSYTKNPFIKTNDRCFSEIDNELTCKASYLSICSTGDFFGNKVTVHDEKANQVILQQRKISASQTQILGKKVLGKLYERRITLFKTMTNEVFNSWVNYIKLLVDAAVKTQSHNASKGACGEAAKASVVNSLLKQLETHTHESVQIITLTGTPIFHYKDSVHVFAVYNSEKIESQSLKDNRHLAKIMKNLKPQNKASSVVTCDSWANFNDEPGKWLDHIKNGKDHVYGTVTWQKIEATDYSIPSMRQPGMNPKQRKFLIELMRDDILKPSVKTLRKSKRR